MLGPWKEIITGWLKEDLTAPVKQRHTGRRVWQRLVEEHGAQIAESTVTHAVSRIRKELAVAVADVAVHQTHAAGAEAEVDFGEFWAVIAGIRMKLWMFVMRLSYSGKAVHVAYANQAQESFLDGHVLAFERFGGVPVSRVRYDNLKPAVIRLLLGRERVENPKFIAMRSHYGFDSFFCRPGVEGAHEKGGVEGEVGRYRRRWLTPVPEFATIAELNEFMAGCDAKDDQRVIGTRPATVASMFTEETAVLRELPDDVFEAAETLSCKVDAKAMICVRQSYYSVPARHAGRRVSVRLGARRVEVFADGSRVGSHVRAVAKYTHVLELDHYLEVLGRKPGALAGSTALASARASGAFTAGHQRFWDKARAKLGDREGTRALVEVLLLSRTLPVEAIEHAMNTAATTHDFTAERLAVAARNHGTGTVTAPKTSNRLKLAPGVDERILHLPQRSRPSLARYDQLLATAAGAR